MINFDLIQRYAEDMDIVLSDVQKQQFDIYAEFLVEYNEKVNLTAITDPDEIVAKHFADCMLFAGVLSDGESVIDVGTGAGFPGVVAKIINPTIKLTLLDSLDKRITFLKLLCEKLGIEAEFIHGRAEEVAKTELRESFDVATARAVANLNTLSEFCVPFVKQGGRFIAMKGKGGEEELEAAMGALQKLGCSECDVIYNELENVGERYLIFAYKDGKTPDKYPRAFAKIKKAPLR